MPSFGRFLCVLVPFLLTLAALVAMLVAGLAGIADKGLYNFQVNVTDLSLSPLSVSSILDGAGFQVPNIDDIVDDIEIPDVKDIDLGDIFNKRQSQTNNITAEDLGLYNVYDVNIWNYCFIKEDGGRECTKGAFNWAANELNISTGEINSLITESGLNVTLPKEITDAVKAFGNVSKWTQIVFVISYVSLALALLMGLFANFSRIFSCITWLISFVATLATGAAAALATATSAIIVGAVEASTDMYGVEAKMNKRFLATVWIGAAFAIAAGLFWAFTICCCKPDHSSRGKRNSTSSESEKFIQNGPGYQRLSGPGAYSGSYGAPQQQQAGGAYEPYSHARV
jgi:hypothetical protein